MKGLYSDSLITQMIESDFVFSVINRVKKNNNDIQISSLGIKDLNKSLKQVFRMLSFVMQKKNFCIYLWVQDFYFSSLLIKILSMLSISNIKVSRIFPNANVNETNVLILIGNPYDKIREGFYTLMDRNKFSLVLMVNTKQENNSLGFYKLYNNIEDYKKLTFFLVCIIKILKIENNYATFKQT